MTHFSHVTLPHDHTHGFGFIQVAHADVATIVTSEVQEVKGCEQPEVETRDPDEDGVLKALRHVRVLRVPCAVPVLQKHTHKI